LHGAFEAGELNFFGDLAGLAEPDAFTEKLHAMRQIEWVVFAKPPFGGPVQVLAYLSRYTHRVAIANSRIADITEQSVTFRWKDYRHHGKTKLMTLDADEFIRRFLQHTPPDAFHRIRHYGILANSHRAAKIALCRKLLAIPSSGPKTTADEEAACSSAVPPSDTCPCCGGLMITLAVTSGRRPLWRPIWNDTS
jgi:hypothetical protein